jgi:hypothetical protein
MQEEQEFSLLLVLIGSAPFRLRQTLCYVVLAGATCKTFLSLGQFPQVENKRILTMSSFMGCV